MGFDEAFDRRRRHSSSSAHRIAWYLGASLLPFAEAIPAGLPAGEADDLAVGERPLHEFLCALYLGMHRNRGAYRMVAPPDLSFSDGEWYDVWPDMKKAVGRYAHAIKSLQVLCEIGRLGTLHGWALVLSAPGPRTVVHQAIGGALVLQPQLAERAR